MMKNFLCGLLVAFSGGFVFGLRAAIAAAAGYCFGFAVAVIDDARGGSLNR